MIRIRNSILAMSSFLSEFAALSFKEQMAVSVIGLGLLYLFFAMTYFRFKSYWMIGKELHTLSSYERMKQAIKVRQWSPKRYRKVAFAYVVIGGVVTILFGWLHPSLLVLWGLSFFINGLNAGYLSSLTQNELDTYFTKREKYILRGSQIFIVFLIFLFLVGSFVAKFVASLSTDDFFILKIFGVISFILSISMFIVTQRTLRDLQKL